MGYSSGLIYAPVSIDDVKAVIGSSSNDIGTLCSNASGTIKMFSRRKPVVYGSLAPSASEKWWKATDGNCGIVPKSFGNYRDISGYADGSLNGWYYRPPYGGDAAPYRLLDFDGYDHNAGAPISNFQCPDSTNTVSSFTCTADVIVNTEEGTSSYLGLSDLGSIANCHFGVVAKSGTTYKRLTSTLPVGTAGASVTFPGNVLSAGSWEIYPFLSNKAIGIDDYDLNTITYYSIPYMSKKTLRVSSVASGISISVEQVPLPSSAGNLTIPVYVRNNNSVATALSGGTWKCRYSYNRYDDAMLTGETSGSISNRTVSANTSITINLTVNITQQLIAYGSVMVFVSFLANGTRYVGNMELAVLQPEE